MRTWSPTLVSILFWPVVWGVVIWNFPFAHSAPLASSAKEKVLHIDCTFTGPTANWCEKETKAWAAQKKIAVKITLDPITNSTKKLSQFNTRLTKKDETLEIFGIDVVWAGLLHKDLVDLEKPFHSELPQFHAALLKANTVNGRLLGIPMAIGNGLLFYRKDILDKYKKSPPDTWDELYSIAAELTAKEATGIKGYTFQGAPYEGLTCNFLEWIAGYGAQQMMDDHGLILLNTTPVIRALESIKKQMGKTISIESLDFHERESYDFFKSGKTVFLRAWPSAWPILNESGSPVAGKVGVALLPRVSTISSGLETGHPSALGGWSFAIAQSSDQKNEAIDLIRHLTSAEVQRARATLFGIVPTLPKLLTEPAVIQSAPYIALHSANSEKSMLPIIRPAHLLRTSYPEVSEILWTEVHRFLKGNYTPQEAASRMQNEISAKSKRWRKR